jgi:hypothetical protein
MPIHTVTWLGRLTAQVPGWYFWHSPYPDPSCQWHAVPAPPGVRVNRPYLRADRIDAPTPQVLRAWCQQRGGWRP